MPTFRTRCTEQLRTQNKVLVELLAFHATGVNATVGENAERVIAHEVSGNYYDVLGVRPQLGRGIRPGDDTAGSEAVVVISDDFWEREFARSRAVLGQSIKLNDVPVTIVGVNPRGFTGAASTLPSETPAVIVALAQATLVTPASDGRNWIADPASRSVNILARTKPGVSDSAAQAALDTAFPPSSARRSPFTPATPCRGSGCATAAAACSRSERISLPPLRC